MAITLRHFIRYYDNVLDTKLCDVIIKKFERHTNAHVKNTFYAKYDPKIDSFGTREPTETYHRSLTEINISEHLDKDDPNNWIKVRETLDKKILECVERYKRDCDVRFPREFRLEDFRIKRYRPGGDEFSEHVDVTQTWSATRFLVVFFYLNTVAEGGETRFTMDDCAVKPVTGRLVFFPPFWLYPHAGEKVVSNSKYIIGTYLRYLH